MNEFIINQNQRHNGNGRNNGGNQNNNNFQNGRESNRRTTAPPISLFIDSTSNSYSPNDGQQYDYSYDNDDTVTYDTSYDDGSSNDYNPNDEQDYDYSNSYDNANTGSEYPEETESSVTYDNDYESGNYRLLTYWNEFHGYPHLFIKKEQKRLRCTINRIELHLFQLLHFRETGNACKNLI